jgi:hypothetical protein
MVAFMPRNSVQRRPTGLVALFCLALVAGPGGAAYAQGGRTLGPGAPALAEQRYQLGLKLYASGDYEKAADEFRTAAAIFPASPRLAYNLGRTLERLERLEEAVASYREYLRLAPNAEDRADVERLAAALDERISAARPELILLSRPTGARVFLDGDAAGLAGATPLRTRVPAGTHVLEFRLPGRDAATRSVTVAKGQTLTVDVTLPAPPEPLGPAVSSTSNSNENTSSPEAGTNWPAWALVGAGGLGLAAGVGFHVASGGTADDADALGPAPADDDRRASLHETYDTQLLVTRIGYGVGAALLVGGVTWLFFDDSPQPSLEPSAAGPAGSAPAAWRF